MAILRPELDVVGLDGGGEPQSVTKFLDHCIGCALDGRCVTGNKKKNATYHLGKRRQEDQLQLHDEVEVYHQTATSENHRTFMSPLDIDMMVFDRDSKSSYIVTRVCIIIPHEPGYEPRRRPRWPVAAGQY